MRKLYKKKDAVHIYAIFNPFTKKPFYVGASCNPKGRLGNHISDAKNGNYQGDNAKIRAELILKILQRGRSPYIEILESVPESKASKKEREHYLRFLELGFKLIQNGQRFSYHTRITLRKSHNKMIRDINAEKKRNKLIAAKRKATMIANKHLYDYISR